MSGYDDMARHVRDALEESEVQSDGSCIIRPEHYLQLNADFEAWDEADDAKRVSEERRDEVEDEAHFLLARLDDLDWSMNYDDFGREFFGHVAPAIARLRTALIPVPGER